MNNPHDDPTRRTPQPPDDLSANSMPPPLPPQPNYGNPQQPTIPTYVNPQQPTVPSYPPVGNPPTPTYQQPTIPNYPPAGSPPSGQGYQGGYPPPQTYNTQQQPPYGGAPDPYNPYDTGADYTNYDPNATPEGGGGLGGINPSYLVGMVGGLSMLIVLCLVVVAVLLLSQGGEDENEANSASPTPPSISQLTTATITPIAGARTPTPLPTANSNVRPTPLQFNTSAPPPTLGTGNNNNSGNNNTAQTAIGITYPSPNTVLQGNLTILGSASHPNFVQYALEYGPNPNPSNLWYPITTIPISRTVVNNALGAWNTRTVADGNYQVRLHVWLTGGIEDFRVVSGLQIQNSAPTPPQTANRNPQISPISALTLTKGKSVTLALGMTDPDNDPLTYLAQTSNASIVTLTPSGASAITVNALNTGSATVTVSISDGRGGTASTSFSVTVNAPPQTNNPPSIAPIPALSMTTGQSLSVGVTVSDPDPNDTVSLTTSTSAGGVITATVSGRTLNLRGDAQGSVSVNVTATDSKGLNSTTSFVVTVTNPIASNRPPTVSAVGNQTVDAAKTLDASFTATDPDNDPLVLNAVSSNSGVATAVIVGNNVVRLNGVAGGTATITITADDKRGGTANTSFIVTVNPPPSPNNPPKVDPIPNQNLDQGKTITVTANVSDPDPSNTLSIQVVASPTGIASVSALGNQISITGDAAGNTTVTVTVSDGTASVTTTFTVTVNAVVAVNNQPSVDPIAPQTCTVGDTPSVVFSYSDPDNDPVTTDGQPASDNTNFVTASYIDATTIGLNCVAAGTANITVTVKDDKGLTGLTTFAVTVNSPANQSPTVDAGGDQNCVAGDTLNLTVNYSDPEGESLTPVVDSDNAGAATGTVSGNTLTVSCLASGNANLMVTVADSQGAIASDVVNINIAAPANNAPSVDFIDTQTCTEGDTIPVTFTHSDLDGDPVTALSPNIDNGAVANVSLLDNNTLNIQCLGAGSAFITVTVQDDKGDSSSFDFVLNVNPAAVNNPPTVDFIDTQNCTVGDNPTVGFTYSDDNNAATPLNTPNSDNGGVVTVSLLDANTLGLSCVAEGTANITVEVQDDLGQIGNMTFAVNVGAGAPPPPTFDVTQFAEIPNVNNLAPNLSPVFTTGQGNGKQTVIFSIAGDESIANGNFMAGFAAPPPYNLGNNGDLENLINFYNGGSSFALSSVAAGGSWSIEDLFNASLSPVDCNGLAPLECEISQSQAAVMLISFTPQNATVTPKDVFQQNLNQVIVTTTSAGVIPVLATLPDDGSVDPALLAEYNEVIVTTAQNSNVPLWNVYNTMQPVGSGQVYNSGNGNAFDLSDAALSSGGANRRNLAALRVLEQIKNTFFP